jgi:transcriptional regulator with XRE-family HTH domain
MTIGSKIKQFRANNAISQEQFAELAGMTRASVQAIETDRNENPTLDNLSAIAQAMGITIDELVDAE